MTIHEKILFVVAICLIVKEHNLKSKKIKYFIDNISLKYIILKD